MLPGSAALSMEVPAWEELYPSPSLLAGDPDPRWLLLSRCKQGTFCDSIECRQVMLHRPKCASTEPLRDALLCDTQVTIQSLLTQLSKDNAQREFGGK